MAQQYYNPYMNAYPINYWGNNQFQQMPQIPQQPQYMINVDGENSAKSWQPASVPQPNTIIPLFDSDGEHVYFKTYDSYGRMNPLRKGRIVFDDPNEPDTHKPEVDMSSYATKEDLNKIREELMSQIQNKTNQNGNNFRGEKR